MYRIMPEVRAIRTHEWRVHRGHYAKWQQKNAYKIFFFLTQSKFSQVVESDYDT